MGSRTFVGGFGTRSTTGAMRRKFSKKLLRRALDMAHVYSCFTADCSVLGESLLLDSTVLRSVKGIGRLSSFPSGSCASRKRLVKRVIVNIRVVGSTVHSVPKFPRGLTRRLGRYVITRRNRLRCNSPGGPTLTRTITLGVTSSASTGLRALARLFGKGAKAS